MDTKMDETVRKSWQLEPSLVQFTNPLWGKGIEKLSKVVADRLGYQGIPLECVLYKLLVYSEGGHFVKHQDTEKEDGMIATLVVQPPSEHEGGDLVVYRDGEEKYHYDFGKCDESGERSVLMRHLERHQGQPLSEDLANGISKMGEDGDSFAVLLAHEYTENSLRNLGSGALKRVDNARFHALEGANALVSKAKKLQFFIAQLQHEVRTYECGDGNPTLQGHYGISTWFTTAGEWFGKVEKAYKDKDGKKGIEAKSIEKFNFLNPNQETFSELWDKYEERTQEGGYTGNEGSTAITAYTRCAIVAWQNAKHWENAIKFMLVEAAAMALNDCKAIDGASLRQLLKAAETVLKLENSKRYSSKQEQLPIKFVEIFFQLLVKASDPEVVVMFFKDHCRAISGSTGNQILIPAVTDIVRTYDWSAIGEVVLALMDSKGKEEGLSPMDFILHVIDGLDKDTAQEALLKMIVEKASEMDGKELLVMKAIGLLWKCVIRSENKTFLESLTKILMNAETSETGPSIRYLLEYMSESGNTMLTELVPKRIKFLEDQIEALDTR